MNKLVREKQKVEEYLNYEVQTKQDLVLALAKEKKNLTNELVVLLKDIRKSKHKIKKHVGDDHLRKHFGRDSTDQKPQNVKHGSSSSNESSPRINKRSASASLYKGADMLKQRELRNSLQIEKGPGVNLDSSICSSNQSLNIS